MSFELSNAKLVLLAIHLASSAHLDSLAGVIAQHSTTFRKDLILRILLTFLPEIVPPAHYVPLLKEINSGQFSNHIPDFDISFLEPLSEEEAVKKVRRLHLLPLAWDSPPVDVQDDLLGLFLLRRAYRVDEEAGLLTALPDLLMPFFDQFPAMRLWYISDVLPLIRRNFEYYPLSPTSFTLSQFQNLSETDCIDFLLSQTGVDSENNILIGRDLRGLIGPWLQGRNRWAWSDEDNHDTCSAFPKVLEWLLSQATKDWHVAMQAISQWEGPKDVDLGMSAGRTTLDQGRVNHLQAQYLQATLGCAYLVPESSIQALHGVHDIISRASSLLGFPRLPSVEDGASNLHTLGAFQDPSFISPKLSSSMRNDLMLPSNPLTSPSSISIQLLQMLTVSAFLLTHHGIPNTIKTVGDLVFFADSRGQQAIVTRYIESLAKRTTHNQEADWVKAREELLWLRSWGENASANSAVGVFGAVDQKLIETEFLKAILSSTRYYNLVKSIYEDSSPSPLDKATLQETIISQALFAYDHATNPHRMRGGMKKCDEIIRAFPGTIKRQSPELKRIEALLKATHVLSEYRLVLTQGEPFTPVALRVNSDPIAILSKVLEQNPKSYTKLQDFLDIASDMVYAGICDDVNKKTKGPASDASADEKRQALLATTEARVMAMCIEAALREDDFETAYSYVVNRLASGSSQSAKDNYAWRAALQAGKYIRTAKTVRPTHVGTGSVNPDIRHLEQRIECLSTALRIAPATQLQELLQTFRKCEEQLNVVLAAEAANEDAWDVAGDTVIQPKSSTTVSAVAPTHFTLGRTDSVRSARSAWSAGGGSTASPCSHKGKEPEESMSLFDLSRATARLATRNLTVLSSLAGASTPPLGSSVSSLDAMSPIDGREEAQRIRKRDQLREAAMGTLVSGVGWLVGAPAPQQQQQPNHCDDE